jgi:hypothetical protein
LVVSTYYIDEEEEQNQQEMLKALRESLFKLKAKNRQLKIGLAHDAKITEV